MIEVDPFAAIDSLDRVELIMALEEAFDSRIPNNEKKFSSRMSRHEVDGEARSRAAKEEI